MTVADSGDTSGESASYIPAFRATVTENAGSVTGIQFFNPGADKGSAQLNGFTIFANEQDGTPVITFPSGIQEGAGFASGNDRTKMNMVHIDGINIQGSTSANLTLGQQWNNSNDWKVLTITGDTSTLEKTLIKVTL